MSLYQPLFVVVVLEGLQCCLKLLDDIEGSDPEKIFLQRPHEALSTAVAFWGSDKGR